MRALEDAARRLEQEIPGMLAVNIVGGYAFSNVPYAGVAFSVITEGDEARAQQGLRELAQIAWDMREGGIPPEHDLDTVVRELQTRWQEARCCWWNRPTISAAARRATAPM